MFGIGKRDELKVKRRSFRKRKGSISRDKDLREVKNLYVSGEISKSKYEELEEAIKKKYKRFAKRERKD